MEILLLPPILKALIMLLFVGAAFPAVGVGLLRLNLLPLRFMLMHGAILGGVLAVAFDCNALLVTALLNMALTMLVAKAARSLRMDVGNISMFFMVVSIALAFIFLYKFNVLAKDMMTVLWGSIYTSTWGDVIAVCGFSVLLLLYHRLYHRQLQAFYFDREIAYTAGVNEGFLYYSTILLTAVTIAIAMKIIGAMLLDALLLLPALTGTFQARSARGLTARSALWGLTFTLTGFLAAIVIDVPVSSAIAVIAACTFAVVFLVRGKP